MANPYFTKERKPLYILGGGALDKWPYTDVDVWPMNAFHVRMPEGFKPAAWFQIHRAEDLDKQIPEHLEWLKMEHAFPIYMADHYPEYPSSVPLPVNDLIDLWPFKSMSVSFASSFSWQIAMAILLGYKKITLRSVGLTTPREAFMEAPNLMTWIGIAGQRGIDVDMDGRLGHPFMYGIEPRGIPVWASEQVATDLVADYYNLESRMWLKEWRRVSKNPDHEHQEVYLDDHVWREA